MSDLTKEQIKGPDRFQKFSKKIIAWVDKNSTLVKVALAGFIIAGVAYAGYEYYREFQEEKAQVVLFEAQKAKRDFTTKTEEAQAEKTRLEEEAKAKKSKKNAAKSEAPAKKVATPEELIQLREKSISSLQKVIDTYPNTRAAMIAAIQLSQLYLDDQKPEEAMKPFEKVKASAKAGVLAGAFTIQKAKVLTERNECEGALKELNTILSNTKNTVWHAEALLRSGVCYEKTGQIEKAIESYQKASRDFADTDAGRSARKYLVLAERSKTKGT